MAKAIIIIRLEIDADDTSEAFGVIDDMLDNGILQNEIECFTVDTDRAQFAITSATCEAGEPRQVERCADCGEEGKTTGHQECQYPKDHEDQE